ncbi:phosphotyrosyl phosphate activator, variant [Capsaspora owczarzaki ATCC 30864]|uniref:Serine/threonine-protein phosphatase 2A activator n=1 Tax=Capsaspora owczarzaki (strain ATCC 30864) TaxID=595528 RepID=E9C037_CAPO3|nr:phosphotyrosyl phosphate activator [Capsaspora owczarzaki ATCC 30864]XP_011270056.1 phosphotyrosyl phosphate activator, variant [Capsaspora owczarzaki ATCC 30864]KJE90128.1 phosphotyrosyl phosphate activator [Capsaspora owczarzaki ATCC 30864]|eukprot:XP_004364345.1 phosphotyrosyl phosphate activator [Capsaspora owczarzaki ATCC 30864]
MSSNQQPVSMPPPVARPGPGAGASASISAVAKGVATSRPLPHSRTTAAGAGAAGAAGGRGASSPASLPPAPPLNTSVPAGFAVPTTRLTSQEHIAVWRESEAYAKMFGFVNHVNEAVVGVAVSEVQVEHEAASSAVAKLLALLEKLNTWIDEIPPIQQPMRFGNKAFRTWMARLEENAVSLTEDLLPEALRGAAIELAPYLIGSCGNKTRLDYGTGHELAFLAYLCCLTVIGVLTDADRKAVALRVVERYLVLMRRLQRTYMLEPAGSHGVWGLDDHQFIPYIWGSSQLIGHPELEPAAITDKGLVAANASDYLFLAAIQYINDIKSGPFHEHSPMLYNLSGVKTWEKANTGLLKMFKAEVLEKFPVIQHFMFGSILPLRPM